MQFTGKNLQRVLDALELAIAELHNQIAMCPDVIKFEQELADYEAEKKELERMAGRIRKRLSSY